MKYDTSAHNPSYCKDFSAPHPLTAGLHDRLAYLHSCYSTLQCDWRIVPLAQKVSTRWLQFHSSNFISFRQAYNIFEPVTNLPTFTDTQVETDNHHIFLSSRLRAAARGALLYVATSCISVTRKVRGKVTWDCHRTQKGQPMKTWLP